jgi:transcriptional regulator with XRE-family HTH domain
MSIKGEKLMSTTRPLTFGDYVKEARERHDYSAHDLAALVGVAASTIARIEYNTIATPGPERVLALIENLDLDPVAAVGLLEPYRRLTEKSFPSLSDYLSIKYKMKQKDITEIKRCARQLGYDPK